MRRVSLFVAAAVAVASLAACRPAKTECNDGTRQPAAGRTACLGHGGTAGAP